MKLNTLIFLICLCSFAKAQINETTTTIGLIGCHVQDKSSPSLDYFADLLKPQYVVWLGDNVYADTEDNPKHIENQLNKLESKEGFKKLKATTPFFITWDDHDYGLNNAGYEYKFKEESKAIHRKFWDLEKKVPEERDGVYYAEIVNLPNGKKIHFIMLDGRYNKIDGNKKVAKALGEKQWQWLDSELQKESDLTFIVCGYQVLLPKMTRWESWAKQGDERKRLIELLVKRNVSNAIFLTGDQHTSEVLKSQKKLEYQTYEIMACGINQTERPGRAPNRVMGPDLTLNSAPILEITWEKDYAEILVKIYNVDSKNISSHYTIDTRNISIKN